MSASVSDMAAISSALQAKIKENSAQKKVFTLEATKRLLNRAFLIFWLVSTVFLLLRIILRGIGADPHSVFGFFIYFVSGIFMLPFFGILSDTQHTIIAGDPVLDTTAFLAIFCYTVLILLAASVLFIVVRILETKSQVDTTLKTDKPIDPTLPDDVLS